MGELCWPLVFAREPASPCFGAKGALLLAEVAEVDEDWDRKASADACDVSKRSSLALCSHGSSSWLSSCQLGMFCIEVNERLLHNSRESSGPGQRCLAWHYSV